MEAFKGREGRLEGKLLKCGIPRGHRIQLETESREKAGTLA